MDETQILTIEETAAFLKISISQVRRLMYENPGNPLPHFFLSNRSPRIKMDELQKWIDQQAELKKKKEEEK